MSLWGSTVQPECHITVNMYDLRTACSNHTGCTGNGKYTAIRNVFFFGESAGCSCDSSRPWRPDTTALRAADNRHVDTDFSNDNDRWKAVSDQ